LKALRQRSISINYRWSIHRAIPIALGARIFSMGPVWRRTEHRRSATSSAHIFLFRDTPLYQPEHTLFHEAALTVKFNFNNVIGLVRVGDPNNIKGF